MAKKTLKTSANFSYISYRFQKLFSSPHHDFEGTCQIWAKSIQPFSPNCLLFEFSVSAHIHIRDLEQLTLLFQFNGGQTGLPAGHSVVFTLKSKNSPMPRSQASTKLLLNFLSFFNFNGLLFLFQLHLFDKFFFF